MTAKVPAYLRFCPTCHRDVASFRPGPSGRADATCPRCGAHERHRFLALVLDGLAPWLSGVDVAIDVAPSRQMTPQLRRLCPRGYFSMDFDPGVDGRLVDLRTSLTQLPLPDASTDFMVCYHVLEHIPDDRAAMAEIARVLKPGGMALVQVPWRGNRDTDEDPAAPVEERLERFGQADHVRYYGRDFDDRLRRSGLDVTRFTPLGVLGSRGCELMRLSPVEAVWAVRPAAGPVGVLVGSEGMTGGSIDSLVGIVAKARAHAPARQEEVQQLKVDLQTARLEAAKWENAYRTLRGRAPVRALAGLSRRLRR